MNQATLSFPASDAAFAGPADRIGFDIGWDHAHHGLVPPAELLHQGTPVMQGWLAGKAVFGRGARGGQCRGALFGPCPPHECTQPCSNKTPSDNPSREASQTAAGASVETRHWRKVRTAKGGVAANGCPP